MSIQFERRRRTRMSFTAIMALIIVLGLIVIIPKMIIARADTIINQRLEQAADTSFVRLYKAAGSYLTTANNFPLSSDKVKQLRKELSQKGEERFAQDCEILKNKYQSEKFDKWWQNMPDAEQKDFCEKWKKILPEKFVDAHCSFCVK